MTMREPTLFLVPLVCLLLLPAGGTPTPLQSRESTRVVSASTKRLVSLPVVYKRDARLDRIPTLSSARIRELCCKNQWASTCCPAKSKMVVAGSLTADPFKTCIETANNHSYIYTNVTGKIKQICTINGSQKAQARQRYCNAFKNFDAQIQKIAEILVMFKSCNGHLTQFGGRYSPAHLPFALIDQRNSMMRKLNSKCCNVTNYITVPQPTRFLPSNQQICQTLLDLSLDLAYRNIKRVENLESLGRRRTCLRGCAGHEHVDCALKHCT